MVWKLAPFPLVFSNAFVVYYFLYWITVHFFGRADVTYLTNLWQALDLAGLESAILRMVSVLLCLTVHETCHGLAAYALGDPTAKVYHRLSLNPLRHIDWLGLASMFLIGVGWAKPVPVDMRYFRNPKQGMALTALAGPASNFVLALLLLAIAKPLLSSNVTGGLNTLSAFLVRTAVLSVGLGLFNLIPIPPLDGSKVLAVLLPDSGYRFLIRYERYGFILVLLLVSAGATSRYLSVGVNAVFHLFCRLLGI